AQGRYLPDHWYFVQFDSVDVGALILAHHPATESCELVYMGVVPEARGRGLGQCIVQKALTAAAELRAKRLVLAVDADNKPAMSIYRDAGLVPWDRRTAYAHCLRSK